MWDNPVAAAVAAATAGSAGLPGPDIGVTGKGKVPPPLLRSRTLPAIVVPGINILQAQIEARYGKVGMNAKCAGSV
ncbi:hypothetical protein B566_EDAN003861 [Ephemera danica]|nr:hypothetical protein B566_EDAN003861 [Ephemera danica]